MNGSLNQSAKRFLTQTINNAAKWKERLTNTRQRVPETLVHNLEQGVAGCMWSAPRAEMPPNRVSRHSTWGNDDSLTAVQPQGRWTLLVCAGHKVPHHHHQEKTQHGRKSWSTSPHTNL